MSHQNPYGKNWPSGLTTRDSGLGNEETESWESFPHSFHKLSSNSLTPDVSIYGNTIERKSTGDHRNHGTFNLVGEREINEITMANNVYS